MSSPSFIVVSAPLVPLNPNDYIAQVMADEPAAYYKFHSDYFLADYSGNHRDGAYNSTPVTRVDGPLTDDDSVAHHALLVPAGTSVGTMPNDLSYNINEGGTQYNPDLLYQPGDLVNLIDGVPSFWIAVATTQGNHPTTSPSHWAPFSPSADDYPLSLATFTPWTIEFWLKQDMPSSWTVNESLLRGTIADTFIAWGFYANALPYGAASFSFYTGTLNYGYDYATWNIADRDDLQDWNHIVVTNDGEGNVVMYANAEVVGSLDLGASGHLGHSSGATGPVTIYNSAAYGDGDYYLSHLAFYPRKLSDDRIAAHYNAAP